MPIAYINTFIHHSTGRNRPKNNL